MKLKKNIFSEYFDNSSPLRTEKIYKEYRDFMIFAYQQNPQNYLTQTACRRNLAGDVGSILRIHSFLEHWGLINFLVVPEMAIIHNISDVKDTIFNEKKTTESKEKVEKVEKVENGKEEIDEKNTKESERPSTHQQQTSNLLTKKKHF